MSKETTLISQIITFHSERVLAHFSLSGLVRMREFSQNRNIALEFVLVLDKADTFTTRIVKNHPLITQLDQIIEVNHGDVGLSRNMGINLARGDYIGIMDGDDFYSANWPVEALDVVRNATSQVVVHPELCISFGAACSVLRLLDMNKEHLSPAACLTTNPWVPCSFATKEIYTNHPYASTYVHDTGYGYEDWHWNVSTLAENIKHVCAPQTAYFYRRKKIGSLLEAQSSAGAIFRPSKFLDQVEGW